MHNSRLNDQSLNHALHRVHVGAHGSAAAKNHVRPYSKLPQWLFPLFARALEEREMH